MNTGPLKHPDKLFIGGEWVAARGRGTFDVMSSATEELYVTVAAATVGDIDRAVDAARAAFDEGPWPRLTHEERARHLYALADRLAERVDDIAASWSNEMGILNGIALTQAKMVPGIFKYYAGLAGKFPFVEERRTFSGAKLGLLAHEPVGVVGAIIPWNAPMILLAFKLAPALIAGCTVVVKASPEAPCQPLIIAEAVEAAGLPPGVVNVLTADREESEALVRNPDVDKIAFTGSTAAGMKIAALAGGRMARYTMELGGKSAALILDDYDLGEAAKVIAEQTLHQTGQVCAALTRVIVREDRQAAFVDAIRAEFERMTIGDPFDPATQMGPLATGIQRERVEGHIARAREAGCRLVYGGGRPPHLDRGFFLEPTVFADVAADSALAREEVFGPVLAVIPVTDEAEAIAVANRSDYGLAGAVFTNDADKAYDVARRVRTGTISHNAMRTDFTIAFGGFKQSGVGREGGIEGLRPYLEAKTILLDGIPSAFRPREEAGDCVQ